MRLLLLLLLSAANPNLAIMPPPLGPRADEAYSLSLIVGPVHGSAVHGVVVDWTLPAANPVEWIDPRCTHTGDSTWRCSIPFIAANERDVLRADLVAPEDALFLESRAISVSPAPESPVPVYAGFYARTPSRFAVTADVPDGAGEMRVTIEAVRAPADPFRLRFAASVHDIVDAVVPPGWSCERTSWTIDCAMTPLATGEKATVILRVEPPYAEQWVTANVKWIDGDHPEEVAGFSDFLMRYRDFHVTTTADAGAGSFRQALLDASDCRDGAMRCHIRFDLPDAQTIRALSPLPHVSAIYLLIDGADSHVVLDGSPMLGAFIADGLVAEGIVEIRGVTVQSFPGNGIKCASGICTVAENVVRGNALRGITVESGEATITGNVVSGNWRSGIWANGSGNVSGNVIRDNGASGVFVLPDAAFTVSGNEIAGNAHYGIAVGASQFRVAAGANRIFGNALGAIDVGLDGPTPAGVPVITSATYDPATRSTTIIGTVPSPELRHDIYFYAGGEPIGSVTTEWQSSFVFRAKGDLGGRDVRANAVVHSGFPEYPRAATTELSAPVAVR